MNMHRLSFFGQGFCALASILTMGMAAAKPLSPSSMSDAQDRYRQDMAFCDSGQSSQPVNACKQEARNALAEAKRGGLSTMPDDYQRNALARCSNFQGEDRKACEARILHPTHVDGSVDGGGLLRESVVTIPAS
jgi:hypothetical protein